MSTTPAIRLVTSIVLLLGLFGGAVVAPAVADQESPRSVAAKSEPLMKKKCRQDFRSRLLDLNLDVWVHAYNYYEGRRKAEQVMVDQLRWALADPQAHGLIPIIEQAAAVDRANYQPVVAKLRDDNTKDLDKFASRYLGNGCLSEDGKKLFKGGIKYFRASFKDIYKAHEQLFRVNLAVQTAQMAVAEQALQDADLEAATISENWHHAYDKFYPLKH